MPHVVSYASMPNLKGFLRSTGIFIGHTVKHWLTWISAGLASLVGWATYVYSVPAPAVRYSYISAAILLAVAFCWTFHLTLVERDTLLDDRKPKFELVFDPKNDDDSRPYLQTLTFPDGIIAAFPSATIRGPVMVDRRYRVGIANLSSATVPNVSVTLEACNPTGNYIHLGHHLLVMDSDPPVAYRDLPVGKAGEPTLWFDVVNELGSQGEVTPDFSFCYANPNIAGPVPRDSYDIVLRAEGGNTSVTRAFRVHKTKDFRETDWRLLMRPL